MKQKQLTSFKNVPYPLNGFKLNLSLFLFIVTLFSVIAQGYSQNRISGTISDANGIPLIGATVIEKGTDNGSQSDFDGNFLIENLKDNATLIFSYIGFKTVEISIEDNSTLDVILQQDYSDLDEVVVTGYGSQRKSDITGSIGRMTEGQMIERPVATINQALAGKVAGVQINTASGRPGGRTKVRIRGISSINTGNDPLYVVDGVQLPQGAARQGQGNSAIDYINPADIVSIEVLKDASATAIYGARGANGVILVSTTKI